MRVVDDIELFMSSSHPGRVLDAFPEATVVVRRWGDIIAHNEAWRRFVGLHRMFAGDGGIGHRYDDVIRAVAQLDYEEAESLSQEVRAVLGGVRYSGAHSTAARPGKPVLDIKIHLPGASSEVGVIIHRISPGAKPNAARGGMAQLHGNRAGSGTIINGEPAGISLLDGALRLLQWNDRFPDACGAPAEILEVGLPMEDILRAQARSGEFGGLPTARAVEAEVARRLAVLHAGKGAGVFERNRPNGQVLELRRAALPGGGYVTLYTELGAGEPSRAAARSRVDAGRRDAGCREPASA